MSNEVNFAEIPKETALRLIDFAERRNLGKSTEVAGATYTLDFISINSSSFFKSRGFSIYYRTGRSIVRISDHWAKSEGFPKSRKLNCFSVSGKRWAISNTPGVSLSGARYCGKYPWRLLAGRAALIKLNVDCEHWRAER